MSILILKDTSVEMASQDDRFLMDAAHLVLEVSSHGQVIGKVDLFPRESRPGLWNTDEHGLIALRDAFEDFTISVSREIDGSKHQLLGFIELNGSVFYDGQGSVYEIPLICDANHPSLVLKTSPWGIDDIQSFFLEYRTQQTAPQRRAGTLRELQEQAIVAYQAYQRHGKPESLEQAINLLQRARDVVANDDLQLPRILNNLGLFLRYHFELSGKVAEINDSISRHEEAISLIEEGNPERPGHLSNLGTSLWLRFERLGDPADLENAIKSHQAAVNLTSEGHPEKPLCLTNLGNSLVARFKQVGDLADLDNAIRSQQTAVDLTPEGRPEKPLRLTNLGSSLWTRFKRLGDLNDLDNAIKSQQKAVNLTPEGHFQKPDHLINLGSSLEARFERLGDLADLDNAIKSQQAAANLTSEGHPEKPFHLSHLGNSLCTRWRRLGNPADLDNAIKSHQTAVNLTPEGHPEKPLRLTNLGNSLWTRFKHLGDPVDIDNAIKSQQTAVNLTPEGHPEKPIHLTNLGNSLWTRYQWLGDLADLDNAIESQRTAVDLTPEGHPDKPIGLTNLGTSLAIRFKRFGDFADIDNAIKSHQAAVNLTPKDHHQRSSRLNGYASALGIRFIHQQHLQDASLVISTLSASVTSLSSPPIDRFNNAKVWSMIASLTGHPSLLDAYEHAIATMPLVAWLGLPIANRHQHLVEIGDITRDAAAAAISLEQYDKALEWLEQGRSIVWTQILQLRTPVDDLRDVKPELATRLVHISRLLDKGTELDRSAVQEQQSEEEQGRQYRALTMERESIIDQVRSLPKFENFLRPPGLSQLMNVAKEGCVVVLSVAKERCDALALVPGLEEVIHIPLPNINFSRVTELANELNESLCSSGIRMRGERAAQRIGDEQAEESCEHIFAELWNNLVKPVLDSLAFSSHPDEFPRIWWCATGPLAFLPIHAAGIYDSSSASDQISNYAISSYIPSISTLLEPLRPATNSTFKLLSVVQPSAPGASAIPNTKEELECIRRRLSDRTHVVLEGEEGTRGRVMKTMEECNWLHLACHGVQQPGEPTKSALILQDGDLTLEEIIRLNLPNAEFAFLSACQTTKGDEKLSEEAVHIAGGMLLAGYRGVVATMWSIRDDLAPEVADEFYAHLTRDGQRPDSRKAAEALHISIQKLRQKRDVPLTAWIPFVHLGV